MSTVSVIIPTYNRSNQVCNAIESVIKQTYKNIEIIVVDNGSVDDTKEKLKKYKGKIKYYLKEQRGASVARNYGIERCNGKYVAFLDSDDTWHNLKIQKQIDFLEKNKDYGMVLCDYYLIDKNGKALSKVERRKVLKKNGIILKYVLLNPNLIPSTVLVKREVLDNAGCFDINLVTAEDLDLHLRIASQYKIGLIEEALVFYNIGNEDKLSNLERTYNDNIYIVEKFIKNKKRYISKSLIKKALFRVYISAAKGKIWHENYKEAILYFRKAISNISAFNELNHIFVTIYVFILKIIKNCF